MFCKFSYCMSTIFVTRFYTNQMQVTKLNADRRWMNTNVRMSEVLFELICLWDCTMTLLTNTHTQLFWQYYCISTPAHDYPESRFPACTRWTLHTMDIPALFSFLHWHIPFTPLTALLTFSPTVPYLMPYWL